MYKLRFIALSSFMILSLNARGEKVDYSARVRTCVAQGNTFSHLNDVKIQDQGSRLDQGLRQVTNVVTLGIGTLVNDTVHEQTVELSYVGADGVPRTWRNCLLRDIDMSGSPFKNTVSVSDCDFPKEHEGLREWQCHYPRQEQAAVAVRE